MLEDMSTRRCGVVPLVKLRSLDEGDSSDGDDKLSISSKGGVCSADQIPQDDHLPAPAVRIKHLTRTNLASGGRFPKLDECAHFHYENVELSPIKISLCDETAAGVKLLGGGENKENEGPGSQSLWISVTTNGQSWTVRRSYDNFRLLDRQLHRCVFDRKYSCLPELLPPSNDPLDTKMLEEYLGRLSVLTAGGGMINCGPVLNWLELDNRGHRLLVTDEAALNTPAVAAAYVVRPHHAQAADEISFNIGDMISVIDMPPAEESTWWRGKKGFQVGFFPSECVEVIGEKIPHTLKVGKTTKPVLRKHGKLIAFFRSFLLSRPSRRKLKQTGILKERVFGCDLGEHLQNTGRDIPLVLEACTDFLDEFGIVDGIYRLSGITSNIQKLRVAFDEDTESGPDLRSDDAIRQDVHCVASLLKMYFRELPNPLLTFQLYGEFVGAVSGENGEETRLMRLRAVVARLPPPHYRTLRHLLLHLARVASHGHATGMTPRNVAIVWAPNLLRSRSVEAAGGGVGALHVIGIQAVLTEYLIRYADILFNHKLPTFSPPLQSSEGMPRKTRPKSLAVCSPTKLLSLEEARSRALAPQRYIDVGGGPENLPPRYHTILELPGGHKKKSSQQSGGGWRSFFSRHGWHAGSTRTPQTKERTRKVSTGSLQGPPSSKTTSPLSGLQGQAMMADMYSNKLRPVKSAESLVPLGGNSCRNSQEEETLDIGSRQSSVKSSQSQNSSSRSSSIQKHGRSTSHDSYFDQPLPIADLTSEWANLFDMPSPDSPQESKKQKLDHSSQETRTEGSSQSNVVIERYGNEETVIVEVHATRESSSSEEDPPSESAHNEAEMLAEDESLFIQRLSPISLPQLEQFSLDVKRSPEPVSPSDQLMNSENYFSFETNKSPIHKLNHCDYNSYLKEDDCAIISNSEHISCDMDQEHVDPESENHSEHSFSSHSISLPSHTPLMDTSLVIEDHFFMPEKVDSSPSDNFSNNEETKEMKASSDICSLSSSHNELNPLLENSTENYCAKSQSLLFLNECSLKSSSYFLESEALVDHKNVIQHSNYEEEVKRASESDEYLADYKADDTPVSSPRISLNENDFTQHMSTAPLDDEDKISVSKEEASFETETNNELIVSSFDDFKKSNQASPPQSPSLSETFEEKDDNISNRDINFISDESEPCKFSALSVALSSSSSSSSCLASTPDLHIQEDLPLTKSGTKDELSESPLVEPSSKFVEHPTSFSSMASQDSDPLFLKDRPKFKDLFSKFENNTQQSHPPPPTPRTTGQLSLFTQLKILKLQAHSNPCKTVPYHDPWHDPILDQLEKEEDTDISLEIKEDQQIIQPTDHDRTKPNLTVTTSRSTDAIEDDTLSTSPSKKDESSTIIAPTSVSSSPPLDESISGLPVKSISPEHISSTIATATIAITSTTTSTSLNPSITSEEERTRRERIERIKEVRRAQLREKLKLEHLIDPDDQNNTSSYRQRKSCLKSPGETAGDMKMATSPLSPKSEKYLRSKIPIALEDTSRKDESKTSLLRTCSGPRRIHERAAIFERPLDPPPSHRTSAPAATGRPYLRASIR